MPESQQNSWKVIFSPYLKQVCGKLVIACGFVVKKLPIKLPCFYEESVFHKSSKRYFKMDRRSSSQIPGDQALKMQNSTGNIWLPVKFTLCQIVSGTSTCPRAGKHHELIMALAKSPDTPEVEKTDFKKSLDKFMTENKGDSHRLCSRKE